MGSFRINGGKSLKGVIYPQGAKNEALQILCAVLLSDENITIENVPDIKDVNLLIDLLDGMGVDVKKVSTNNSSSIKSSNIDDLIEGVNVKHEIFGIGTIKKVDNHSNQKKAIVNFKNVGEKTLLLNFAKLKVIK